MFDKILLGFYKWLRKKRKDNATFLLDNGDFRCMNFLSFNASTGEFKNMVKRCKSLGADTLYLYFSNEKDGRPNPTSFYEDGNLISGRVSDSRVKMMQERLMFAIKEGMYIDGWLFADDSPSIAKQHITAKLEYARKVVELFDSYLDRYVVALEANEYLRVDEVDEIAKLIQSKSKKPVGLHLTKNKFDWSKMGSIDIHYHQYGFGRTPAQIEAETVNVRVSMGKKPVIAAEYDLSSTNKALGDAAMRGGAKGTGNGRTI